MSPRGLDFASTDSGDADGAGVGNAGVGGTIELRRLDRGAIVLFLFRGEEDLVGDAGSLGAMLMSWSKMADGSTLSPLLALRVRTDFLGDTSVFVVVCLRVVFLGLFCGAGVNSSSCSSRTRLSSSSDSSSSTIVLRAARRNGRAGDSIAGRFMWGGRLESKDTNCEKRSLGY